MTELVSTPQHALAPSEQHDVVIIGAGPAGLAAAVECARHGQKVLLLDEQAEMGGQIYRAVQRVDQERKKILGEDYMKGAALAAAAQHELITYLPSSVVWQVTREKEVSFKRNGASQTIAAEHIILATGALERPFPVPGWTLPGVLSAGGAQVLLKGSGVVPAGDVVLAGCGPLLYLLAYQYISANVPIKAIIDTSGAGDVKQALPHLFSAFKGFSYIRKGLKMVSAIKKAGIPFYKSSTGIKINGEKQVESIEFMSAGSAHKIDTDLVLLHQGVMPNTQISWSLRAEHTWDTTQHAWLPVLNAEKELDVANIFIPGDGANIGGAEVAALEGRAVGLTVCHRLKLLEKATYTSQYADIKAQIDKHSAIRSFINVLYEPKKENRIPVGSTIVCRCEGVTAADIVGYVEHGCVGPNQAKSFGRCGMGPCQGRECGTTVTDIIADQLQTSALAVGYYRIRPPIKPITLAELANNG